MTAKLPEVSVLGQIWVRRSFDSDEVSRICQKCGIGRPLAEIIAARGIDSAGAEDFLAPSLRRAMPDPLCLKDLDKAVARLVHAVQKGEKIGVFGDYDVDGVTSTALLLRYFRHIGAEVIAHLPDRLLEGYGPNEEAFKSLRAQGCRLCLTVDCGAVAHQVIETAVKDGLEIIVIDHHQMTLPGPPALAIVNPNRPDDSAGLGDLSAVGVTFMVLAGLARALRGTAAFDKCGEPPLIRWLDLVALGLVCDVMALRGFTRVLVAQGVKAIGCFRDEAGQDPFPGLSALAAAAGARGEAGTYHLGFVLGPRINAAGRVGHAREALELLVTRDHAKASAMAAKLNHLNAERQNIEAAVIEEAIAQVEAARALNAEVPDFVLVAKEGWHPGVIGIVAGRLKEKYHCPAIVISLSGSVGKGSGRSIPGIDLGAAIAEAVRAGVIRGGGGHAMAAGLTLEVEEIAHFEAFLAEHLGVAIKQARLQRVLSYDAQLTLGAVKKTLCDEMAAAGPFGSGNPEPRFVIEQVKITHSRIVGANHIACSLYDSLGRRARAICFRCVGAPLGDRLLADCDQLFDVAGRIKPDEWRGGNAAQLQIEDIRPATGC